MEEFSFPGTSLLREFQEGTHSVSGNRKPGWGMVPVKTDQGSGLNIAEELSVEHSQLSGECPTQLLLPNSTSQSWKNSNPYNAGWGVGRHR